MKFYRISYLLGLTGYILDVNTADAAAAAAAELASKYGAEVIDIKEVNYVLYGLDRHDAGHEFVWYATDYAELMWLRREHKYEVLEFFTEYLD